MDRTREHLDLLGVFHYVVAGLTLLCGGGYGAMLLGMAGLMQSTIAKDPHPPPPEFLLLWNGMGLAVVVGAVAAAAVIASGGYYLRARRGWTYCVIVAALSTAWVPIGTVLGVFSLVVLMRPEAKALFGQGPFTGPPSAPPRTAPPSSAGPGALP
jgi:hypothetical protein